jgi:uncharacterized protein YndB with AHSA1/START domain
MSGQMIQDVIEREVTIRASKQRVFKAVSDPAQLVAWFPDKVEGAIRLDSRAVFDFGDGYRFQVLIVALEPDDYFAYRWVPANQEGTVGFVEDVLSRPNTLVEFRLEEISDGTRVRLRESGFSTLPTEVMEQAVLSNSKGWDTMLGRLETYFTEK